MPHGRVVSLPLSLYPPHFVPASTCHYSIKATKNIHLLVNECTILNIWHGGFNICEADTSDNDKKKGEKSAHRPFTVNVDASLAFTLNWVFGNDPDSLSAELQYISTQGALCIMSKLAIITQSENHTSEELQPPAHQSLTLSCTFSNYCWNIWLNSLTWGCLWNWIDFIQ